MTSVWHVPIDLGFVSFILPSHPVSKRMATSLYIFSVFHPYGCFTPSSMHTHTYTSTTWELAVYEMPWDENLEKRNPALFLSIINGNIWATPQLNFSEGWNVLNNFTFSTTCSCLCSFYSGSEREMPKHFKRPDSNRLLVWLGPRWCAKKSDG